MAIEQNQQKAKINVNGKHQKKKNAKFVKNIKIKAQNYKKPNDRSRFNIPKNSLIER